MASLFFLRSACWTNCRAVFSMAEPLNPALYFLPVADRDCVVELLLPVGEVEDERPAKRTRSAAASAAAPCTRVVVCDAASQLLKAASPKFRC